MFKKYGIPSLIALAFAIVSYYFTLPALNLRSGGFWAFLIFIVIVWFIARFFSTITEKAKEFKGGYQTEINISPRSIGKFAKKTGKVGIVVIALVAVLVVATFVTSSKLFNSAKYRAMLTVENSEFTTDIAEIPFSKIPVVDRDTAVRLGSRKIGEVVELVSQFNISQYNVQINYNEKPVRVSPLEYDGPLKWLVNRKDGIPYYVKIDMATQATELVYLKEGMKYSPSEYFSRDLMRHVRFKYPTKMFAETSFEIDDNGDPYWILPYYNYTFGILGGKDITGIILVDAVTGEITDYPVESVPQWIDRVYPADFVLEQAHNWGVYVNGYWNSVFAQKNVVVTTDGYNYLALRDDVWLYTGITSVVSDESNIGFILINLRTKECLKFDVNGAEEYSAMDSAEGMIQEKGYKATFPILMNIEGVPSYFVSLKDNAGLVKAYSFVSIENYQIVGVSDTIDGARNEYLRLLIENGILNKTDDDDTDEKDATVTEGIVSAISTAVVNGNSLYYIKIDDTVYKVDINVSDNLPFIKVGDSIKLTVASGKVLMVE